MAVLGLTVFATLLYAALGQPMAGGPGMGPGGMGGPGMGGPGMGRPPSRMRRFNDPCTYLTSQPSGWGVNSASFILYTRGYQHEIRADSPIEGKFFDYVRRNASKTTCLKTHAGR